jgi:GT2 family glycosyltransferase
VNPTVSIIIPLYNGAALIPACLNAVLPQVQEHGNAEVIVVDNASTDNWEQALAPFKAAIRHHRLSFNTGFATAVNVGIQLSRGEIIILLNQDAIVQASWLNALLARFEASPQAAIVGSKCMRADGTIDHAGGIIRLPLFYTAHFGLGEPDLPPYNQPYQPDYVTGAALALRRALLDRVGWFDQGFYPAYYEETDLCLRARDAGYEVWYEPAAVVLHQSNQMPLEQMSIERIAAFHRNRLRCLIKHTESGRIGEVLRNVEVAELESPQAVGLLTGRAIAYRDLLHGIVQGDPMLSNHVTPEVIEALAQCYRLADLRARQVFDTPLLPLQQRTAMAPRAETWRELSDGINKILAGFESLNNHFKQAASAFAALQPIQPPPGDGVGGARADSAAPAETATHTDDAGGPSAALLSARPEDLTEAHLALHRQLTALDQRLAQLAEWANTPPATQPKSWRARLQTWWQSLRLLVSVKEVFDRLFRWQRENALRTASLIGEARGLTSIAADSLLLAIRIQQQVTQLAAQTQQQVTQLAAQTQQQVTQLAAQTQQQVTQLAAQTQQQVAILSNSKVRSDDATLAFARAISTTCQFLHECISWQADLTHRLHELHQHTAEVVKSEAVTAVVQVVQSADLNSIDFANRNSLS